MRIVAKEWGREEIEVETEHYTLKRLVLMGGFQCSIHRHKKHETFVLRQGRVVLEIQVGENISKIIMVEDFPYHVHYNNWHRFIGISDAVITEVSTKDCESDRMTKSGKVV